MIQDWHRYALKEIRASTKPMTNWERKFMYDGFESNGNGIAKRIELGLGLTEKQEEWLVKIHQKRMDVTRRTNRW